LLLTSAPQAGIFCGVKWPLPDRAQTERDVASIEEDGFVVIEELLCRDELEEIRRLLRPHLADGLHGRNDFEGHRTQRVYALVSRGRIFEDLVRHPRVLAICDRFLATGYLLTASQAICIHPGETPQGLHSDDAFYPIPRPRPAISMSTIWSVDAFTAENGATQVIPRSHGWSDGRVSELFRGLDFSTRQSGESAARSPDGAAHSAELEAQLRNVEMPPGSVIVFSGTLLHRGGAGRGTSSRLVCSNQYCEPWARQQENFTLGIASEQVLAMHERVRQMLGFSIHGPFMGHFGGLHPERLLDPSGLRPQ
jgi:ectoine hydroxylase-related dioxygenase (phytanoyl-CoA dioxygenase family)